MKQWPTWNIRYCFAEDAEEALMPSIKSIILQTIFL